MCLTRPVFINLDKANGAEQWLYNGLLLLVKRLGAAKMFIFKAGGHLQVSFFFTDIMLLSDDLLHKIK